LPVLHCSIVLHCQKYTGPTLTLYQTMHLQQTKPPTATAAPLTAVTMEDHKESKDVLSICLLHACPML
jgi:hypothetical protein